MAEGIIFLFIGPAGSGKSTGINYVKETWKDTVYIPSVVTRDMRVGEVEGDPYHFVTEEEFMKKDKDGELMEKEKIHGNWYGTSRKAYRDVIEKGNVVVKDIGVEGAELFKREFGDRVVTIYIDVEDEVLIERMRERGESEEEVEKRMKRVSYEKGKKEEFDHVIGNREMGEFLEDCKRVIGMYRRK